MRSVVYLVLVLVLVLGHGIAGAAELERPDQADGVHALALAAERGDVVAQRRLAALYQRGEGVAKNLERAAVLYRQAADQGDAEAQFNLANLYLLGEGVPADEVWAMTYYRRAAEQGHALARRNLSQLLRAAGIDETGDPGNEPGASVAIPNREREPDVNRRPGVAGGPLAAPQNLDDAGHTRQGALASQPSGVPRDGRSGDENAALRLAAEHGISVTLDDESAAAPPPTHHPEHTVEAGDGRRPLPSPGTAAQSAAVALVPAPSAAGSEVEALHQAAEAGEVDAQFELANRYLTGDGVKSDEAIAITLLRAAARNGHAAAYSRLAGIYADAGLSLPPLATGPVAPQPTTRHEQAPASASEAAPVDADDNAGQTTPATPVGAEHDDRQATRSRNEQVANQNGGANDAGRGTEIAEPVIDEPRFDDALAALQAGALERAATLFTTLAQAGHADAQAHIGYMTYQGEGIARDPVRAVEWYRLAAAQGHRDAQYNLAVAYASGEGAAQDDAEAVHWYRMAAAQGSVLAQYSLGIAHAQGMGTAQSDAEAVTWYLEAAGQGYPAAQYNLAHMFLAGRGVVMSTAEALHWFRQAAEQGHAAAQYNVAHMYRTGIGADADRDTALHWYRLAAAQGHAAAQADLQRLTSAP
ncbi:MAG: tetratricopeptide repeat protein [Gammaproteobacteria bacterium]